MSARQLIIYGAPGTGKSWWIKNHLNSRTGESSAEVLRQRFLDWLPQNGVVSSALRYCKSVASISEEPTGAHNQAEWPGCFELLVGHKPEKTVFEAASLVEFERIYQDFELFLRSSEARLGTGDPNLYREFYNWSHSRGAGTGAGFMLSAFSKYKAFLAWNDAQHSNASVIRTTFHPDSDYSTFVGSYKPSVEKDKFQTVVTAGERNAAGTLNKKDELFTQKRIVYKFVAQSFIKAYVDAWKYKAVANGGEATRKYLVIEEINRGNCAQIFGDLFQLLDRNDEGFSDYEIAADDDLQNYLAEQFADLAKQNETSPINLGVDVQLAKRILSGEVMLLPENLYIWATMNTSDQSLFPIDSAFKRRWEWKYMPIYDAQKDYKIVVDGDEYKWWDFLEKANALVQEFTDSEDKKLGYFFCKADASNTIPLEQFVGKVIFYLWNDVFKDTGFDHKAFDGDNDERLLFKTFFNPDGSPKPATVKRLMENLGVSKVAEAVA